MGKENGWFNNLVLSNALAVINAIKGKKYQLLRNSIRDTASLIRHISRRNFNESAHKLAKFCFNSDQDCVFFF